MALQFNRYQCRSCGKPALHVRNTYDVPNLGYLVALGFLFLGSLVAREAFIAATCLSAGAVVVALGVIHSGVNWIFAGVPYRCQTCGCEPGESQKAI